MSEVTEQQDKHSGSVSDSSAVAIPKDCAVFECNDKGELKQLTVWTTEDNAKRYKNTKDYFPNMTKVVLRKIDA